MLQRFTPCTACSQSLKQAYLSPQQPPSIFKTPYHMRLLLPEMMDLIKLHLPLYYQHVHHLYVCNLRIQCRRASFRNCSQCWSTIDHPASLPGVNGVRVTTEQLIKRHTFAFFRNSSLIFARTSETGRSRAYLSQARGACMISSVSVETTRAKTQRSARAGPLMIIKRNMNVDIYTY